MRDDDAISLAARLTAEVRGGPVLKLWASSAGGLEREAAGELSALGWNPLRLPVRDDVPYGKAAELCWERGSIYGEADLATVYRTLWSGRTITRITLLQLVEQIGSLAELEAAVRSVDFSWLPFAPFAIRMERVGEHPFRSPDIGRVAGRAVIEEYERKRGRRLPVDLVRPAVEVRVELTGRRLRVGVELVSESLHRRPYHRYRHMAGLKATLAAGLLRLGGYGPSDRLLDPMCGGGTIPVEAALAALARPVRDGGTERLEVLGLHDADLADRVQQAFRSAAPPRTPSIFGLDRFATHVEGATRNVAAADVAGAVQIRRGDATRLERVGEVDRVVTNPPYGMRAGRPAILDELYSKALAAATERLSPGGTIVVLTPAVRVLRRAARGAGLLELSRRSVSLGRMDAVAFLLRRA